MEHPYTMIVSGQTGCGKTHFIYRLLHHFNDFNRVIVAYSMFQPVYLNMMKLPNVELSEGMPENVDTKGEKTLLILDDLMMENDKKLATFFTRMRHANLSTIFITQNFYFNSSYMRTVTRNAHYLVLFSNPRDVGMISCLGRQMFPQQPKFLSSAFEQSQEKQYGYLFVDCKPNVEHRVKEGIFPDEQLYVYKPLNA